MSGLRGTFAGVLATLVTFAAIDFALLYVLWGIVVVVAGATAIVTRLWRGHAIAVIWTAALCAVLTVPLFGVPMFLGAWGAATAAAVTAR